MFGVVWAAMGLGGRVLILTNTVVSYLLQENSDTLLLESGDTIQLEV